MGSEVNKWMMMMMMDLRESGFPHNHGDFDTRYCVELVKQSHQMGGKMERVIRTNTTLDRFQGYLRIGQ